MTKDPRNNCIFLAHDVTNDKPICILNRIWPCHTDATVCGDLCPDYEAEKVTA